MKNIKLLFSFFVLLVFISSCKVYSPVYKRVENFRVVKLDKDGFGVYGDVVMYNPNRIPVKLKDVLMNVELNGKHVITAGQKEPVKIMAKSEFAIPLNLKIKPDMTFMEGLRNLYTVLTTKQVDLTVKGVVVISAFGIKVSIPIEQKEKFDLTKLK